MGRKSRFSTDEKLEFVLRYIEGKDSINNIAKQIGVNKSSLRNWIRNYQSLGIDGLNTASKNTSYSEEEKELIEFRKKVKQLEMENDILKQAALPLGKK